MISDATPKTLYVSRKVLNAAEILKWAKSQGFTDTLDADDLHVTVCYSRTPIDWMAVGSAWESKIEIPEGGARIMETFGDAKVLLFKSSDLEWRHGSFIEAGASWDHPEYQPHITIAYDDTDLSKVEAYKGKIVLGPEIFEEVNDDWRASLSDGVGDGIVHSMIKFTDTHPVGSSRKTAQGYLVATARIARTGVQEYLASEVGLVGDHMVRINRPAEEVFHADSIKSLSRVPVTMGHPNVEVTADNWKDLAVGEVGDSVMKDGEWLVVNPMLKDSAAIASGLRGLSMGYTAELRDAPAGSDYDYDMVNIRHNHLALCALGRAGHEARIGDSADKWGATPVTVKDDEMTVEVKSVVFGDKAISVEAKDADTVVAILKDHKSAIDAKDAEIGRLEAELADAKSKVLTDEQVEKLVADRAAAKSKRDAVIAKVGDKAKEWSDAQIEGAYLVVGDADDSVRKAIGDIKPTPDANALIADAINKRFNKDAK